METALFDERTLPDWNVAARPMPSRDIPGDLPLAKRPGHRDEWPRQIADKILSRHFKGNDDVLALVARYPGMRHE